MHQRSFKCFFSKHWLSRGSWGCRQYSSSWMLWQSRAKLQWLIPGQRPSAMQRALPWKSRQPVARACGQGPGGQVSLSRHQLSQVLQQWPMVCILIGHASSPEEVSGDGTCCWKSGRRTSGCWQQPSLEGLQMSNIAG